MTLPTIRYCSLAEAVEPREHLGLPRHFLFLRQVMAMLSEAVVSQRVTEGTGKA